MHCSSRAIASLEVESASWKTARTNPILPEWQLGGARKTATNEPNPAKTALPGVEIARTNPTLPEWRSTWVAPRGQMARTKPLFMSPSHSVVRPGSTSRERTHGPACPARERRERSQRGRDGAGSGSHREESGQPRSLHGCMRSKAESPFRQEGSRRGRRLPGGAGPVRRSLGQREPFPQSVARESITAPPPPTRGRCRRPKPRPAGRHRG
jgi:hypothetical protein